MQPDNTRIWRSLLQLVQGTYAVLKREVPEAEGLLTNGNEADFGTGNIDFSIDVNGQLREEAPEPADHKHGGGDGSDR